ncbi:hypothetical protein MMC11_001586 [Xylographa trunciseda]|nr:hypothetical protein [Xylographa trunciseda]
MLAWLLGTGDSARPPPFLKLRSARWFILMTVSCAVFTDIFLYGIIVPVVPFALSTRAGIPEDDVQHWVSVLLAVYGGALLIASPFCGWLADKAPNRRLPLLVGLLTLGGATVMLCVGSSIGVLVAGRLLQGLSAAIVWTVGLALLVDTVGQTDIGQTMGSVFLSMSLAFLVAPLLGGIVYARAGYYAVFYIAFGVIVLDISLRLLLIEKKVARKWLDEPVAAASPPPAEPSSLDTDLSPAPPAPLGPLATPRFRLPPIVTLLASRRLLSALWACLVQATLTTAFDSVLPLYAQATFGWTSTGAGLLFLPLIIPSFAAPLIGFLADRHGPRYLAAAGFLLAAPPLILLRLVAADTVAQKVLLCALLALVGFGLATAMVPLMAEVTYVVEAKERKTPGCFGDRGAYAQAYALFNVFFAAGTLIGPIWGGFVVGRAGWGVMTLTLGLLAVVTSVPAVVFTGGMVTRRHKEGRRWGVGSGEGVVESGELGAEVREVEGADEEKGEESGGR